MSGAVLRARGVSFRYPDAHDPAVHQVSLEVAEGTVFAVLGANGSGKSTLLGLLTGRLASHSGTVELRGRPVRAWPARERARELGVVLQSEDVRFPMTVRQSVALGRYPHLGPWTPEGREDRNSIHQAMERAGVDHLAARSIRHLSGGERQRVRIARALAQEARVLVLDEPTSSLDLRYEMEILELLSDLVKKGRRTVVWVTHSLNLAARYADRLLLLANGRVVREGDAAEVLDRSTLEEAYGWSFSVLRHPGPGPDTGAPQVVALRPEPPR